MSASDSVCLTITNIRMTAGERIRGRQVRVLGIDYPRIDWELRKNHLMHMPGKGVASGCDVKPIIVDSHNE
jgi:hypothetical protein